MKEVKDIIDKINANSLPYDKISTITSSDSICWLNNRTKEFWTLETAYNDAILKLYQNAESLNPYQETIFDFINGTINHIHAKKRLVHLEKMKAFW